MDLDWDGDNGSKEKWKNLRYIFVVKLVGFVNRLYVGWEGIVRMIVRFMVKCFGEWKDYLIIMRL